MIHDLSQITWRKSKRSQQHGECVEVASLAGRYAIRDSKNPDGPVLVLSSDAWAYFADQVKQGPRRLPRTG